MGTIADPKTITARPIGVDSVAGVAHHAGFRGEALVLAVAIAFAETGGSLDSHAIGDRDLTQRGEMSVGLWQINYRPTRDRGDAVRDPQSNLDPGMCAIHAYSISRGGTSFTPWSTYTGGQYKAYLPQARTAAAAQNGAGGTQVTGPTSSTPAEQLGSQPIMSRLPDPAPPVPVRLGGAALAGELGAAVTGGSVDLTTDEVSQLTLELEDPDLKLLSTHKLAAGTSLDLGGLRFEVVRLGITQGVQHPHVKLTAHPPGTVRMREQSPLAVKNVSPTVYMAAVAKAVGLRFLGQPTQQVAEIGPTTVKADDLSTTTLPGTPATGAAAPTRLETAWEVGQRLARSLGFLIFEAGGVLYFGLEGWLTAHAGTVQLSVRDYSYDKRYGSTIIPALGVPDIDGSRVLTQGDVGTLQLSNLRPFVAVTVSAKIEREWVGHVAPGRNLMLSGCSALFDGDGYLVTRLSWSLNDLISPASLEARLSQTPGLPPGAQLYLGGPAGDRPVTDRDVTAIFAATSSSAPTPVASSSTPTHGSKLALDFVTFALRQVGDAYVWGAEAKLTDPDPDAFDCSELVQWAAAQVGVTIADGSSNQRSAVQRAGTGLSVAAAAKTRGALLFAPGHVAISLGDGKTTVEARGRKYGVIKGPVGGRSWDYAGKIPGMRY